MGIEAYNRGLGGMKRDDKLNEPVVHAELTG
jgi:hypothetical protein